MNNELNKEVFSEEELSTLNEKLQKQENIILPESLSAENVEELLNNPELINKKTEKPKKSKKKWIGFVALAASFAIVVTSVLVTKPWEKSVTPSRLLPPKIEVAQDYTQIEEIFLKYAALYKKANKYNYLVDMFGSKGDYFIEDSGANMEGSPGVTTPSVNSGAGSYITEESEVEFGVTNEQVEGVSEADIIKNDGQYIYVSKPAKLRAGAYLSETTSPYAEYSQAQKEDGAFKYECEVDIVKPEKDGRLTKINTVSITTDLKNVSGMSLTEMYVSGNKLIAFVECNIPDENNKNGYWYGYSTTTMVVCFDITVKENVKELWKVYQDGSYVSSRLIGDRLVILSEYYVNIGKDDEIIKESCVPETAVNGTDFQKIPCDCVCIMNEINDTSYLVASTMEVNDSSSLQTKAVLGGGSNVYCTTETLYVTSTKYENINIAKDVFGITEPKTNILKFSIKDNKIIYLGSCSVKGTALNQFSMDEYNGNLRIATTTGSWGDSLENQVYVIDSESLETVGELTGLGKGESIRSVRFSGNTGYVVTFMQTDPLFVIDFSNPQKPELKGELKITGFSSYLHPVGENLLVGVGPDGTESGTNNGLKVSLFDVSDPTNPIETDKLVINGLNARNRYIYVSSPCYDTHKAFCWNSAEKTMYIPYGKQDYGNTSDYVVTLGILSVRVDEQTKKLVNEGDYKEFVSEYKYSDSFTRVTYIDDVIVGYSYQGKALFSFDKSTQIKTGELELN